MTPLISLVTGTFNRRESLARMLDSARSNLPRGLAYELVIVDGGSTDGTQAWCKDQPDIRLIEHGELRGAIRAFDDGARAAQGEYVLLANDDITFKPYSILAALAHLEQIPTCAAVAFADNRTSRVRGDGTQYRTEGMGATTADGRPVMVTYAQVGLFRRTLADQAGWWGDRDPVMGAARTYGGDNYLSSRLWEMGYTVDPVTLAAIEDRFADDGLRRINGQQGQQDSACYYRRYPTVPLPAQWNRFPVPDRLRILHLPVYESGHPGYRNREAGLTEALAAYGLAIEVDYLNVPDFDLVTLCQAWQPDLLITQMQNVGPTLTPYKLAAARNAAPGMTICNWNGDAHERGLISPEVVELLRQVDLQLTVNAKVLPVYAQRGIQAAYWQIGYKDPVDPIPDMPTYDVLFQGNCYNTDRDNLVKVLRDLRVRRGSTRRINLGLYGNCHGANGNTHYDFAAQRGLIQRAQIVVGDTFPGTQAFVSNRVFQTLAAGGFLLQQRSESLELYTGLQAGVHYVEWTDLADLRVKVSAWLDTTRAAERAKIAAAGRDFVRANFSFAAQARKLFEELLPMIEVEHATA